MADDYFPVLVFSLAGLILVDKFLKDYGYQNVIVDLKFFFILLIIFLIFLITFVIILKRYADSLEKDSIKIVQKISSRLERPKKEYFQTEEIEELPSNQVESDIEDININLDLDKRLFWHKYLNKHEVEYLKNKHYLTRTYKNYFTHIKEKFMLKPNSNETDIHAFVVLLTEHYLRNKYELNLELFESVNPDIVFEVNKNKCAIEVETGKILQHNKNQLNNKVNLLNQNYSHWIFILTNKNLVSKYRKYGQTIDLRYLKKQLEAFLKEARKKPRAKSGLTKPQDAKFCHFRHK